MTFFDLRIGRFRLSYGTPERPDLFVVRHGQSRSNVDRDYHNTKPDPLIELSPLGHRQARQGGLALADYFDRHGWPKRIRGFHSEYLRAEQTWDEILSVLLKRKPAWCVIDERKDSRIHELEFGWLSGMTDEARDALLKSMGNADKQSRLLREQGAKYYDRRMGGESPADLDVRLRSFLDALYRDRDENGIGTFIVVSHGLTNRVFAKLWLGEDFHWYEQEKNPRNVTIRHLTKERTDGGYIHYGGMTGIDGGHEDTPTEDH